MTPLTRILSLLALLGATLGAAQAARITLCEDINFRGRCVTLDRGVETLDDLGMNDRISSIRVDGEAWQICTDARFQGECAVLDGTRRDLAGTPFQDRISSLRPARESDGKGWGNPNNRQQAAIVVYQDANFSGRSRSFTSDVPDLSRFGLNDKISSVRVQGGHWRLCRDADYQNCINVDQGGIRDLSGIGLNDAVSSLQLVRPGDDGNWRHDGHQDRNEGRPDNDRGIAILFEDANFGGRALEVRDALPDLGRRGFNDRVSSIRITRGRWQICRDANFQGRCEEISHSIRDLSDHDFNDAVSSIRPLR
ncbi:beta/gamma crystallin-related protein [Niveibacterium terrae]|uniref:beta/gamma crystallin-related protein n=1 Tax=Niveibacterium terrae TaxID=3373598 RepID=UPI003A90CE7D